MLEIQVLGFIGFHLTIEIPLDLFIVGFLFSFLSHSPLHTFDSLNLLLKKDTPVCEGIRLGFRTVFGQRLFIKSHDHELVSLFPDTPVFNSLSVSHFHDR